MAGGTGKRPYRQRLRAESAALTRQRIIDAARVALTTQPLRTFTISDVADVTGVVRTTVYAVFGSREGLLRAVVEDARVAVVRNIREGTRLAATEQAVITALSAMASVDPEAAAVMAETDALRLRGLHSLARRLGDQGYLRPELDHDQVVDVLYVLTDRRAVERLYRDRDLDHTGVADLLITMATRSLCRPERLDALDLPDRREEPGAVA